MLRLILGRAGTGKTAAIISEIADKVRQCRGRSILLVPEQYSHEAERELCAACGDTLSLYGEVLSFTGLARRIAAETGGESTRYLDKGGRMLCMALAAGDAAQKLKVYSAAGRSAELQAALLDAVTELKSACVSADDLYDAAAKCGESGLADKLTDMARVLSAYDAVMTQGSADPGDRLTKLAESVGKSSIGKDTDIYFDGFSGFSAQELRVIRALLEKGANITACLTADSLEGESDEVFAAARKTAYMLLAAAEEFHIESKIEYTSAKSGKDPAIEFYTENMFGFLKAAYPGKTDAVRLYSADNIISECEFAASECLRLVRERGCRWRDIAIAVRGFDTYAAQLESCFAHYGVPLFMARKSSMASKPVPLLISTAYQIIENGWDVDDMLSYLGTGLTGVSAADADTLGTYVYLWQLHAAAWKRPDDWQQHPDGFGAPKDDAYLEKIKKINEIRRIVAAPLLKLEESSSKAETAEAQAKALARYFEDIGLAKTLEAHAEACEKAGKPELAAEYSQVWNIIVNALEQCAAVLGSMQTDMHSFSKLFLSMLSSYDIGTIPVALDRVSAGDFDRMRRRSIRHLIVLGANDSALPRIDEQHGIFTGDDRHRMLEDCGLNLAGSEDDELWEEFSLIYNCLSLPSETLTIAYCTSDGQSELRPSIIINSARSIFGISPVHVDMRDVKSYAEAPALSLAANAFRTSDPVLCAAKEYFESKDPMRLENVRKAADFVRGKLSPQAVRGIYGTKIKLSASKIDTFSKCRYEYFCRYGMEAEKFEPIGFRPPEIGTYVHEILEKTAKEVKDLGGWKAVDDNKLTEIADKYTAEYVERELNGFKEKSERFIYLFRRMRGEVLTVIHEMAEELRNSEFEPIRFEFNFADRSNNIEPIVIGEEGEQMMLTGIADRIDGWLHNGRLYVRIVDYKTGTKAFTLSDVWYGSGLQMLLYLYALTKNSSAVSDGPEVVPAGVMYLPAKVKSKAYDNVPTDEDIAAGREKDLRRSGIVIDDEELTEAWEHGDKKIYMPVNTSRTKDFSATEEQFDLIFRHIVSYLAGMTKTLHEGDIEANPLSASNSKNACMMCDYAQVCRFADGENSESFRDGRKLSAEDVWTLMEGENKDGE